MTTPATAADLPDRYIMYVTDAVQDRNDIEMLRENMVKSKGRNNFKNLFLYAPQLRPACWR